MAWFKRRYESSPWAESAILNRFETLFTAQGAPAGMLLVEQVHEPAVSTLWLRLPDGRLVSAFPECEAADEAALPKVAVLLGGHHSEFEKLFTYGQEG